MSTLSPSRLHGRWVRDRSGPDRPRKIGVRSRQSPIGRIWSRGPGPNYSACMDLSPDLSGWANRPDVPFHRIRDTAVGLESPTQGPLGRPDRSRRRPAPQARRPGIDRLSP